MKIADIPKYNIANILSTYLYYTKNKSGVYTFTLDGFNEVSLSAEELQASLDAYDVLVATLFNPISKDMPTLH